MELEIQNLHIAVLDFVYQFFNKILGYTLAKYRSGNTASIFIFYTISKSKKKNYCSFQTNMIKYPKKSKNERKNQKCQKQNIKDFY